MQSIVPVVLLEASKLGCDTCDCKVSTFNDDFGPKVPSHLQSSLIVPA